VKKLIGKMAILVMLAGISICYGCGPSAAIMTGILTHGNQRAMRDAFRMGTVADLTAGNIALNRLARTEQPPVVVVESEQAEFVEQEQPPEQAEFVEPVIIYGEPSYLPCPIVVGYPYDYYTYENVGGFVNVVFWRNGQRFHREEWRDGGRRMRANHIRDWARSHKVSREIMGHHRNQLVQRHNIRHNDAHYGLRPAVHAQKDSRQNQNIRQQVQRPNESLRAAQQRPQQRPQQAVQQRAQQQRPQQAAQQRAQQQRPQQAAQKKPQQKKNPNQ
jgi:hypothetical protein